MPVRPGDGRKDWPRERVIVVDLFVLLPILIVSSQGQIGRWLDAQESSKVEDVVARPIGFGAEREVKLERGNDRLVKLLVVRSDICWVR